jgi:hypothetical protein
MKTQTKTAEYNVPDIYIYIYIYIYTYIVQEFYSTIKKFDNPRIMSPSCERRSGAEDLSFRKTRERPKRQKARAKGGRKRHHKKERNQWDVRVSRAGGLPRRGKEMERERAGTGAGAGGAEVGRSRKASRDRIAS